MNNTNNESSSKYGRKKNLGGNKIPKHLLDLSKSGSQNFDLEEEILLHSHLKTSTMYYQSSNYQDLRRSKIKRSTAVKQIKPKIRKTNPINSHQTILSHCGKANTTFENNSIVCNHLASSAYGFCLLYTSPSPRD